MAIENFTKEFSPDWDAWDDYRNITNIESLFIETARGLGYSYFKQIDPDGACFQIKKDEEAYTLIKTFESRENIIGEEQIMKEELFLYHLYKGNTPQIFVDITAVLNCDFYERDGDEAIKTLNVTCKKLTTDPLVDIVFDKIMDRYKSNEF